MFSGKITHPYKLQLKISTSSKFIMAFRVQTIEGGGGECQKSKALNEDNTGTFGIIQGGKYKEIICHCRNNNRQSMRIIIQKDHTFSSSTRKSVVFNNVNTKQSSTATKAIILSLTSPKFPTMLLNFQPPTRHVH